MKKLVKATAVMMLAICGMSFYLIRTDYWYVAFVALGIALFWLMSFVDANLEAWTR